MIAGRRFIVALFLALSLRAQDPNVFTSVWRSTFDATGLDAAHAVALDGQGNFFVAGQTANSDTRADGLLMKISPTGQRVWARRYDSPISETDIFTSVATDPQGNAIVAGAVAERDAPNALFIASYASTNGATRWSKAFPGKHIVNPTVATDANGNVYARTSVENGVGQIVRTYKFGPAGAPLWTNEISTAVDFTFDLSSKQPLLVAPDGTSYLATLVTSFAGDLDWLIVKLAPNGVEQWRTFAGGTNYDAQPLLAFHSSGDLLVGGSSQNDSGAFDLMIHRYRPNGFHVWQTKLRGVSVFKAGSHIAVDLRSDSLGNILLAGNSPAWGGFLANFRSTGVFEWSTHFPVGARSVIALSQGRSFLALDDGIAWIEADGTLLKYQRDRVGSVITADAAENIFVASSFYKPETRGDFGAAAEKLTLDRDNRAPVFTKIDEFPTGVSGISVQLQPELTGEGLSFQWWRNGAIIPGATNRVLFIPSVDAQTVGYFQLYASNAYGATLSPDIEVLTAQPIFLRQPQSQQLVEGGDVAFSALAVGFEPQFDVSGYWYLTYQWYRDGIPLWGETKSKLLIRNADAAALSANYQVRARMDFQFGLWYETFSEVASLSRPYDDLEEVWREQILLFFQPWTRPNRVDIKPNGDVALSIQSPHMLDRANLVNGQVVSDTAETFRPAQSILPKGAYFPDSQGNYYAIGETNLLDTGSDIVIAKRASNGALLWEKSVSSLGREIDLVIDAAVDHEDHIIVTSASASKETGVDAFTFSLDKADGRMRWGAVYDEPNGIRMLQAGDHPSALALDAQGNTFIAGTGFYSTDGFYFLTGYDRTGAARFVYQRLWQTENDQDPRMAIDHEGNIVLGGSFGLIKLDTNGRELWRLDLRGEHSTAPAIRGVQVDRGGNIYASMRTVDGGVFLKCDAFGEVQRRTDDEDVKFGEANFDPSGRFFLDDYGNIYLPGTGGNTLAEFDILAIKLDSTFYPGWQARLDGRMENRDEALDIKVQGQDVYLVGSVIDDNTMHAGIVKFRETPYAYLVKDVTKSKIIRRGSTLRLEAQVFGNPIFYQWFKNDEPVVGATSAIFDIPNAGPEHEGFYMLQVDDDIDRVALGAGFAIRIADPPSIVTPPQSTNMFVNGSHLLSATVSGTEPLTYQWQVNGTPIAHATNATALIFNAQYSDRGDYRLVVSNAWGMATSIVAKVTVSAPPNLAPIVRLTEPAERLVQRDTTPVRLRATAYDPDGRIMQVTFRVNGSIVAVVGSAPFEKLWIPPGSGIFKVIAQTSDNGNATAVSQEVEVVIAPPPIIIKHPPGLVALAENSDLTLEAEATSSPPPRYQWRLNGANIPGATNRTYTINGAQPLNSGRYAVLAINEGSAAISSRTEVIVEAPSVTLSDDFAAAITVNDVQFVGRGNNRDARKEVGEPNHARRRGGRSVWLRWRAPSSGVMSISTRGSAIDTLLAIYTGDSLSQLTQVAADDERGGFHCSATRFNAIKGELYHIAIDGFKGQSGNILVSWALDTSARELPIITGEPESISGRLGSVAAYHVDAEGNNLRYQWYLNGYPVPGATDSGLVLFDVGRPNLGDYVVRVTGDGGSVESEVAELELGGASEPVTQDRVEDLLSDDAAPAQGGIARAVAGYPTISPGIPYRKFFNTAGATADDSEPILGDGGGASKWFYVTAGGSGTLVADTIGSDFPNVITLHDPSNTETLPVLAHGVSLAGGASRATYPATNGMSFLIRVDGIAEHEGNVVLNITIGSQPSVTTAPTDTVISAGQSATLTAAVSAAPTATYQWYLNDVPLPGQTTTNLQLTGFDPAQAGIYAFEASNPLGSVKKTIAYVELARDVLFDSPTILANGSMELRLEGNTRTYFIDFTPDFKTWTSLFSGRAENGLLQYTTTPPAGQQNGFYRARWE